MESRNQPRETYRLGRRWRTGPGAPPAAEQPIAARPELARFSELMDAFVDLVGERRDLVLRGSALVPPLGFAVRLQPEPTSAGGELSLWPDGGRLTTWSRAGAQPAHGSGERSLRLDLAAGFRWETLIFPDAARLAATMLRWMEDRVAGQARPGEAP